MLKLKIMKTENNEEIKYKSLSKGLGITGLVLGIVTLLVSFVPCFGMFAIFFGVIAILISLIGLIIALKHNHEKGLIIGALTTSLLGCGIAYSQYTAMNSLGNELLTEANKAIEENIGEPSEYKKKNTSKKINIQEDDNSIIRKKDIELVLEYIENSNKVITNENGLPLNYEYKIKWGENKNLGTTDKISNNGPYRNSLYLNLSISEIEVVLSLNGKYKKSVKLISQIYQLYELNPLISSRIPTEYNKEKLIYTPELDKISIQKEIIKRVTTPNFYQAGLVKNENDKQVSNKWINSTSELIKESNILNLKELTDFYSIRSVNNTVEKKEEVLKEKREVIKVFNVSVDNLRVRTSPDLGAKKIENLALGTNVEFLNEKSDKKTKVTIKGQEINEYWYKVKTPSGNIGWIHGCCFETE